MRNKFEGTCFICDKKVAVGKGHFQSVQGMNKKQRKQFAGKRWLVRCLTCVGDGNVPLEKTS